MSELNQGKAVALAVAGSIDLKRIPYNVQDIITACNKGKLGPALTEWLAEKRWIPPCPPPLVIDRSKLVRELGPWWPVWLGPVNGDGLLIGGEPDQDPRSLLITTFDANKAVVITGLIGDETSITCEERRLRVRKGPITPIDFHTAWDLLKEEDQRNLRWMYDVGRIGHWVETDTVLRHPRVIRCSLALYRKYDGSWDWRYSRLGNNACGARYPVLGLKSP